MKKTSAKTSQTIAWPPFEATAAGVSRPMIAAAANSIMSTRRMDLRSFARSLVIAVFATGPRPAVTPAIPPPPFPTRRDGNAG
jgi:hypothetical protein